MIIIIKMKKTNKKKQKPNMLNTHKCKIKKI